MDGIRDPRQVTAGLASNRAESKALVHTQSAQVHDCIALLHYSYFGPVSLLPICFCKSDISAVTAEICFTAIGLKDTLP